MATSTFERFFFILFFPHFPVNKFHMCRSVKVLKVSNHHKLIIDITTTATVTVTPITKPPGSYDAEGFIASGDTISLSRVH